MGVNDLLVAFQTQTQTLNPKNDELCGSLSVVSDSRKPQLQWINSLLGLRLNDVSVRRASHVS